MSDCAQWVVFYGSAALIAMSLDAAMCYVNKFKFKPLTGFIGAILWPVFLPVFIIFIVAKTEDFNG